MDDFNQFNEKIGRYLERFGIRPSLRNDEATHREVGALDKVFMNMRVQ
jgi:hypothetical protein